jgi:serine protease Do
VVLVEQAGRVLGLGVILNEDGRVLSAASRLSPSAAGVLFVRYADGKLVQARIGHIDRERDLVLLVPKSLAVRKGVQASRSALPSAGSTLASFSGAANRNVIATQYTVKNRVQLAGQYVLELSPPPKPTDLGAPVLDTRGHAVALVVSGCLGVAGTAATPAPTPAGTPKLPGASSTPTTPTAQPRAQPAGPPQPCTAPAVGTPVTVVRSFLRGLPPQAAPEPPWLGVDGISADTGVVRGVRIGRIDPKSPASTLGLQVSSESVAGDVLVAVAGKPVPTPDALENALSSHTAGERVELLIFGKEGYRTHSVRLADRPASVP